MSETLTIKNFGPIKDMSFEFKKINIFIGDQGTGKSTVAKIIFAIKNCIFRELFKLPEIDNLDKQTQQFYGHLDLVGIKTFLKQGSILTYKSPDYYFQFKDNKVAITKNISNSELLYFNSNYIIAERNMVHVLADSLYALLEVKAELPKLFLRFGNKYQTSRKSKSEFNYSDILGIKFTHKNNKDYILLPDGTEINLSDASSGIQGCVALLTVADAIMSEVSGISLQYLLGKNLKLLVIEEPELNCFPQTQDKLIKHLIENNRFLTVEPIVLENSGSENPKIDFIHHYQDDLKNQLFITTHSPYILTSFNNLMYAYEIGQKEPNEVNNIIDKKYWVNSDDVSAYMLLPDGNCEDIFDREENLIKAEKIDGVSRILNAQFEELSNIEYAKL
ncbi:MAG: AAA family ATPase [Bacteroidota bacterium]|nr:AAA family ATPase [Bacteroidota bacterium]